jgi:beta-galactosidase
MVKKRLLSLLLIIGSSISVFSQAIQTSKTSRERISIDKDWRFAFGHPYDTKKDFNNGTGYFSYFAKAAYGDGAAAAGFDDRAWRKLDLPHDWAVEQPFDKGGSFSHGFKAIGRNFPAASVGWYRKKIFIPKTDDGKRLSIVFDGAFRNSIVWINGFYLGTEPSGYTSFEYNISEYLNYGGENTIAVRVDATLEEGWFYEGAGIYRHVWLNKTSAVHVAANGTFVTSKIKNDEGVVSAVATICNDEKVNITVSVRQTVVDAANNQIGKTSIETIAVPAMMKRDVTSTINFSSPQLWSLENPYLYTLITEVSAGNTITDVYKTNFGIRTIRFDTTGFYLNDRRIRIQGTNNHQDHAGVGAGIPDALNEFRLKQLKKFGVNAFRCSHNPPTPELLDLCDRLGMLVIDENRLMGVSGYHFDYMKRFMLRDRNHPSIISWSIGNEEWGIEGNELGAKIATTMQTYAKTIDSTRFIMAAISGGWQKGISNVIDVMGVNYIAQINTDVHHAEFPDQPMWGTEEGATTATRGIYFNNKIKQEIAAYDFARDKYSKSIEDGWKHYAARDYLTGMFIWTGFDYRGEPTPYGWPTVVSYHGVLDLCGFPKDVTWYLKSWWTKDTVLHILPHWNWHGKEGQPIDVWVYSNCDEVELFLNKKSQGKKQMPVNGHLEWKVNYKPGILNAVGYKNGKKIAADKVQTTSDATSLTTSADKTIIKADAKDVAVITIAATDKNGLAIPTADSEISFAITGPGKIIGVGNGSNTSLEAEKFIETVATADITITKEKIIESIDGHQAEAAVDYNDAAWSNAFEEDRTEEFGKKAKALIYRGRFEMTDLSDNTTITFFSRNIGVEQTVFINGVEVATRIKEDKDIVIDKIILRKGENIIAIVATPFIKKQVWETLNTYPGQFQLLKLAEQWKRKLFNGLAQVIIQSKGEKGEIIISTTANGLQPSSIKLNAQ